MDSRTRPPPKGSCSTRTPDQCRWDFVVAWLARADEDLLAAELILGGRMPTFDLVGFHAQQAAEKALKALLVRHAVRFDKTHDLGDLLARAEPVAPGIARSLAGVEALTPYAVSARYPAGQPGLDHEAAGRRLQMARAVVAQVRQRLRDFLDAGRPAD